MESLIQEFPDARVFKQLGLVLLQEHVEIRENPWILDLFPLIGGNRPPAAAGLDLFATGVTKPQRDVIGRKAILVHHETVKRDEGLQLLREFGEQDRLVPFDANEMVDRFGRLFSFQAADDTERTEIVAMNIQNGCSNYSNRNVFAIRRADDFGVVDVSFPLLPLLELIAHRLRTGEDLKNAPPPEIRVRTNECVRGWIGVGDYEILVELESRQFQPIQKPLLASDDIGSVHGGGIRPSVFSLEDQRPNRQPDAFRRPRRVLNLGLPND